MDSAYSVPSDVLFDIHCKRQYSFRFSRESATLGLAISGASPPDWQLRHQPTCKFHTVALPCLLPFLAVMDRARLVWGGAVSLT